MWTSKDPDLGSANLTLRTQLRSSSPHGERLPFNIPLAGREIVPDTSHAAGAGAPLPAEAFADPNGFQAGQRVSIRAEDYGVDPVQGELLYAGAEELILRREDERAGLVHVHFPRLGFRIEAL